jgi:hypothetical protein
MSCCLGELLFLVESPEQVVQVGSGEAPIKGHRSLPVAALEADQPPLDLNELQEVVGVSTLGCTIEQ